MNFVSLAAVRRFCGVLLLAAFTVRMATAAVPEHLLAGHERIQLIVEASNKRCLVLDLYIAATPEQRRSGLMYIEALDTHEGMLFVYSEPAEISMWMKNTLIPLDMLFFDTEFTITHIHRNAKPLSESIIGSEGLAIGVIELNGGGAELLGITVGNRVLASQALRSTDGIKPAVQ